MKNMEYYIAHGLHYFSPKNKKISDMIEYIKKFDNLIIVGQIGLDAFLEEIKQKVNSLNAQYPRTKDMKFGYRNRTLDAITVFVPGQNLDLDYHAFYLNISKCSGIYQFSEKIQNELPYN
ncbi:hypothetical protein FACS1894145_5760 [Bacteroidia bacterium]|nr:hypothetical protein FACS1894145_5760 [Bacteroidia bacterium]